MDHVVYVNHKRKIMNLVKKDIENYQQLLLKRDELQKEAIQYRVAYTAMFGDIINELFQLVIECTALKKKISYCQLKVNKGMDIIESELEQFVDQELKNYYQKLQKMKEDVQTSKQSESLSEQDLKQIKMIYYRLVKKIHPDLHPELFKDEKMQELFSRIQDAYVCNQLDELMNLEVLVDKLIGKEEIHIPDIDAQTEKIKEQIQEIVSTNPYLYKDILENEDKCNQYMEKFKQDIHQYQKYKEELEKQVLKYDIKQVIS